MLFPGTRGLVYRQPTSGRHVALILQVYPHRRGGRGVMLFPGTRGLVYRQPTSGRHVALILQVSTPMMMFIVVEIPER
jgi:hypothetical protein